MSIGKNAKLIEKQNANNLAYASLRRAAKVKNRQSDPVTLIKAQHPSGFAFCGMWSACNSCHEMNESHFKI